MEKNYIKGSFKEIEFSNGDSVINLSIFVDELAKIANEKGYAAVVLKRRKEKDQYGNTHYLLESTYKPDATKTGAKKGPKKSEDKLASPKYNEPIDDLPF